MYYPATFTPLEDGSGRYDVSFVDLPGCVSQGASLEDALLMAQEALKLHVGSMLEDGDSLPLPSSLEEARRLQEQDAREGGYALPEGTLYQFVLADVRKKDTAPVRLSISLKPVIVELIDNAAAELGLTRSGLISVAAREYCNRLQA